MWNNGIIYETKKKEAKTLRFRNKEEEEFWKEVFIAHEENNNKHQNGYGCNTYSYSQADGAVLSLRKRQLLSDQELDQKRFEQEKVIEINEKKIDQLEESLRDLQESIKIANMSKASIPKLERKNTELDKILRKRKNYIETLELEIKKLETRISRLKNEAENGERVLQESQDYRSSPKIKVIKKDEGYQKEVSEKETSTTAPYISIV